MPELKRKKQSFLYTFVCRDWEVRNDKSESYFINICGKASNCGKIASSVCKKGEKSAALNYGSVATKPLPTKPYGNGFSITFNSTKNSPKDCANSKIQTKINFQCDKILVSFFAVSSIYIWSKNFSCLSNM